MVSAFLFSASVFTVLSFSFVRLGKGWMSSNEKSYFSYTFPSFYVVWSRFFFLLNNMLSLAKFILNKLLYKKYNSSNFNQNARTLTLSSSFPFLLLIIPFSSFIYQFFLFLFLYLCICVPNLEPL